MLEYVERIGEILRPRRTEPEKILDLFAGCGGLALGFEAAGYATTGFELEPTSCATYQRNLGSDCINVKLDKSYHYPDAQIVIGGPPCQPFSVGGYQKGIEDARDGFPIFLDAIKKVQPRVFLFENVRGLLYANKWYFELILAELAKLGYLIDYALLNAVDFGVPQNRERLFVVGHRSEFRFPQKESSIATVADAVSDTMRIAPEGSKFLTPSMDKYVEKYERASLCVNPRDLYPEKPARTLTCRNLAGATGDMQRFRLPDGRRRRLLPREAARLQSFPDWFEFVGSEMQKFNQIGNAVPPLLAFRLATAIKDTLKESDAFSADELIRRPQAPNGAQFLFPI